jgi:ribose/xylose/arabinose/galactoside ABC-type transport system permease subunit
MNALPERQGASSEPWSIAAVSGLKSNGVYVFLIVIITLTWMISRSFLSSENISNLVLQFAPLGVVVIGQTFVIISGGLDLSVASIMATAAVAATVVPSGSPITIPLVFAAGLLVGAATGVVNGALVTKRRVSPFLATLATTVVLQGVRFYWTQGAVSAEVPPFIRVLGSGRVYGVPYDIMAMVLAAVPAAVLLHRSVYGRRLFVVGGNSVVARLLGIRADSVTIVAYVISGCYAALGGVLLAGYVGSIDNFVGAGFELDSIVACVIGGAALSGGRGNLGHALVGGGILTVLSNAVLMIGVPIQFQIIIKGFVIIVAAAFYGRRAS